jgi:hypothetical protein
LRFAAIGARSVEFGASEGQCRLASLRPYLNALVRQRLFVLSTLAKGQAEERARLTYASPLDGVNLNAHKGSAAAWLVLGQSRQNRTAVVAHAIDHPIPSCYFTRSNNSGGD